MKLTKTEKFKPTLTHLGDSINKLRIAYLLQWSGGPETGVYKKILSQSRAWADLGAEVRLFVICRSSMSEAWTEARTGVSCHALAFQGVDLFCRMRNLVAEIVKWRPNVVYRRDGFNYPGLESLGQMVPVVFEINSDTWSEMQLRPIHQRLMLAFGDGLSTSSGMVTVTEELRRNARYTRYGKPMLAIANGIELATIPWYPPTGNPTPRLMFIGSGGCPWHGVDKIMWLAKRFPQWRFDLVGITSHEVEGDISPNVTLYGPLSARQYSVIAAKADIGISTLALHRKRMDEASPLKTREYLAYGMPTIIGYKDTDFPAPVPFILELPNSPNNVIDHVDEISRFVESMAGQRVDREEIHHLGLNYKEASRIAFMKQVCGNNER